MCNLIAPKGCFKETTSYKGKKVRKAKRAT